jgi:hypothetical protein
MIGWLVDKNGDTFGLHDNFIGKGIVIDAVLKSGKIKRRYFDGQCFIQQDEYMVRIAQEIVPVPSWVLDTLE